MSSSRPLPVRCVAWLLGALLLAGLTLPAAADFVVQKSTDADRLTLRNLVGEVAIEGHSGRGFKIEVSIQGGDADPELIQVELLEGSDATLNVIFPLEESMNYVYPRMGRSTSKFSPGNGDNGWMSELYGRRAKKKLTVSGRGSGLEIWADVTVRVPAGGTLRLQHGVGDINAGDVEGDLDLDSMSGSVDVSRLHGDLGIDVGSGAVAVERVEAEEVVIDTGSGAVDLLDCHCEQISVDTGSGSVEVARAEGEKLEVDTGSGRVEAREINVESAKIDTGSGSVQLELTGMGSGRFEIDTGSGGIELRLPPDASAEIRADTGSGGIRLDVDGATVRHKDDDSALIVVGGGAADVRLDTGSGGIRIRN